MINLQEVTTIYPECLESASKLRSRLVDLYPDKKRIITIITTIFECGIAEEIKKAKGEIDEATINAYCNSLEGDYSYSPQISRKCLLLWCEVYGSIDNIDDKKTTAPNNKNLRVGDILTLGEYPQGENGEIKPIEWQVLYSAGDRALVISKYILDYKDFNKAQENWETCSLRSWLNNEFYNKAFSTTNKGNILTSTITAEILPKDYIPAHSGDRISILFPKNKSCDIQDKVFVLSIDEAKEYFASDEARKSVGTDYCYRNRVNSVNEEEANKWSWWLRPFNNCSAGVEDNGNIVGNRSLCGSYYFAIRPTMWISIPNAHSKFKTNAETGKTIKVGDVITLGTYPQGANGEVKTIEWQVLKVENGKALVISKYSLDCKPFNDEWTSVTWETCTLRKWLNNEFYNKAFTVTDKTKIARSTVVAHDNFNYNTNQGNDTKDKIFILSIEECREYFAEDQLLKCKITDFCQREFYRAKGCGALFYWLRTLGRKQDQAACICIEDAAIGGAIGWSGNKVAKKDSTVRPAMWIKI